MTGALKATSSIPPLVALVIAGAWLGSQHRSISAMEQEIVLLREHIAAARACPGGDSSRTKAAASGKLAKDKEPLDWKQIAAQFAEMRQSGGMGDMRLMMRLQQRVQAMSAKELVATLDEIAALDLSDASRDMLESMLIGPLIQEDPELALERYADRLQDDKGSVRWQLATAMEKWAQKDLGKATAWFDQQIAAGKFDSKSLDGKNRSRIQFEGHLIGILLSSSPEAAARRLAALPEDQRGEALGQFPFREIKEEDQQSFAKLVRDQIPAQDQARTLAQLASQMVSQGGYEKVTGYLDRIDATPAERTVCVEEAAESKIQMLSYEKKVTREDFDALREWVSAKAPASTDRATGQALAVASAGSRNMDFAEAAELALQYNQASGNDEVLGTFLDSNAVLNHPEQARVLASKITDPKRREEILNRLE